MTSFASQNKLSAFSGGTNRLAVGWAQHDFLLHPPNNKELSQPPGRQKVKL